MCHIVLDRLRDVGSVYNNNIAYVYQCWNWCVVRGANKCRAGGAVHARFARAREKTPDRTLKIEEKTVLFGAIAAQLTFAIPFIKNV